MFGKGMNMYKQAQQMQKKMKELEEYLLELRIEGTSSGKLVLVIADGKKNIKSINKIIYILIREERIIINIDFLFKCIKITIKILHVQF